MKVRIIAYDSGFLDQFEKEAVASGLDLDRQGDIAFVDLPNKLEAALACLAELGTIMLVMPGESVAEATDGELGDDHDIAIDEEHWTIVVKPD